MFLSLLSFHYSTKSRVEMNGCAALDLFVLSAKKRSSKMESRWMYAYYRLKEKYEHDASIGEIFNVENDAAMMESLTWLLTSTHLPKGDGKFSRLKRFVEMVLDHVALIKPNFSTQDKQMFMFLMMIEVSFECMLNKIKIIEKSPK